MMPTLKQQYAKRQATQLLERVRRADSQIIYENKIANLIFEAMDQKELDKISAVIDKLKSLKGKAGNVLDNGIDVAIMAMNKAGGSEGFFSSLIKKGREKLGIKSPIVNIMAFADAIERGFKQLPTILKNLSADQPKNDDDTIQNIIQASIPAGTPEAKSDKALKIAKSNILKAFTPGGIYSAVGKIPFVKTDALVNEFINSVAVKQLLGVSNQISSGPQASDSEVAEELKSIATPEGAKVPEETKQPAAATATPQDKTNVVNDRKADRKAEQLKQRVAGTLIKKFKVPQQTVPELIKFLQSKGVNIATLEEARQLGILKTLLEVYKNKLLKRDHCSKRS